MGPKLGIIAGGGELPAEIIKHCQSIGRPFFVVALKDQAEAVFIGDAPHVWIRLGAAGTALKHLRENDVEELVLAGAVKRPSLLALRPDYWATKFFTKTGANGLGDDGILSALIKALQDEGFKVVGTDDLLPDLIATEGIYGSVAPASAARLDIERGIPAAQDLGALDIGQAVVIRDGIVVGREDEQGTDYLLKSISRSESPDKSGVLVKVAKPQQERRADLPTIGPATIEAAFEAGLAGIAIESSGALILNQSKVIRLADEYGLFVIGVQVNQVQSPPPPTVYLIAGEPSGDMLGARLMAALKTETENNIKFSGIGGPEMQAEGLDSLFPMSELAIMGIAEVVPRLPSLIRRIRQTADDIRSTPPDALVTIDSPDFSFRVAKRVKGQGIPLIHYVAPTVWAWRAGRAAKIAKFLDHLLVLLPFEPPYFEKEGLPSSFVGHPVVEGPAMRADGNAFRKHHGISPSEIIIMALPGSRRGEVTRHLPIFEQTLDQVRQEIGNFRLITLTTGTVADLVESETSHWQTPPVLINDPNQKYDAMAAANVALAASGTVALELAATGTPAVIAYKVNTLTAWLARRLIKVRFANLINLILNREAIPEHIQDKCRPDILAPELLEILGANETADQQRLAYRSALTALTGAGEGGPAQLAASAVLKAMRQKTRAD